MDGMEVNGNESYLDEGLKNSKDHVEDVGLIDDVDPTDATG